MAVTLNGSTDYFTMGTALAALNGKTGVTFTAWFNGPAAGATEGVVMLSIGTTPGSNNARARMQLVATGAKPLQFQGRNTNDAGALVTLSPGAAVAVNTWTFLAVTLDLSGTDVFRWYHDGVLGGSVTNQFVNTSWPATNSETGAIGAQAATGTLPLNGQLADVCIYDRALTAAEIMSKYTARGTDGIVAGLMHRYRFNELSPGSSVTAARDSGVQARTLTSVGGPVYSGAPLRTRRPGYL